MGDEVQQGEVVITASGASVEVQSSGDIPFVIPENTEFLLNDELFGNGVVSSEAEITDETVAGLLEALEAGTDLLDSLEAPAAGAPGGSGGASDEGHGFVRLGRIGFGLEEEESEVEDEAETQEEVSGGPEAGEDDLTPRPEPEPEPEKEPEPGLRTGAGT